MKTGIELIYEERQRQIEVEMFDHSYDRQTNQNGELALVAAFYAMSEEQRLQELSKEDCISSPPTSFPWVHRWWKPTPEDRIKELKKAGALIAAEIDRLQYINRQKMTWNELKQFCNNLPEQFLDKKVIIWRDDEYFSSIEVFELDQDHFVDEDSEENGCISENEMIKLINEDPVNYPDGVDHFRKCYEKGHPIINASQYDDIVFNKKP